MIEITINKEICKKDGLCAMTCMRSIFTQDEKATIPKIRDQEHCYECGQCVAICTTGAISHSSHPKGTVHSANTEQMPTYDQIMELIHNRRSKRLFKDKQIPKDIVSKLIEAARYAPSGHNEQTTEFVIVQDKNTINELGKLTAKGIKRVALPFSNPVGKIMTRFMMGHRSSDYLAKLAPELSGLADFYDKGIDWILRGAPTIMLFCADSAAEYFGRVNANIALHNTALAAETLGLGCFYTGFVVLAADRGNKIGNLIGLPETHKIYGALAMGYPRLKFHKYPERNPAKVSWIEAS